MGYKYLWAAALARGKREPLSRCRRRGLKSALPPER